jgi:hypothetical protein
MGQLGMNRCVSTLGRSIRIVLIACALIPAFLVGSASAQSGGNPYVEIQGDQFVWNGQVVKLKGSNYYPRDHMWGNMWSSWDWPQMNQEVGMMSEFGLNCVRILVPHHHGGWSTPPSVNKLQQLEDIVNLFGENGIRSVVTLFDWETSFPSAGSSKESQHFAYLDPIVLRLRDNPYVLAWDVKNEPDHPANYGWCDCNPGACGDWDCYPSKRDQIVSWLERMCNRIRSLDPNHPVSAGMRWWQNLPDVLHFMDFAIFHSYWPNVDQQINETKAYMGANQRPIMVEEWGWPSHPHPANRDGQVIWNYNETEQLNVYINHLTSFTNNDIAGGLQWMTFDARNYDNDPNESFEHFFGLWRHNLTLKPAGEYYRDNFPVVQFFEAPPGPVTQFMADREPHYIDLLWQNPDDSDLAGVVVRTSTTAFPSSPTDGSPVCDVAAMPGTAGGCRHHGPAQGEVYYYAAFAYDGLAVFSDSATASGTVSSSADFDEDGDVDKHDYTMFEACLTGPMSGPPAVGCEAMDLDADDDVDMTDYQELQVCYSGELIPADPLCGE